MKACYSVSVCVGGPGGPQIRMSKAEGKPSDERYVILVQKLHVPLDKRDTHIGRELRI
jgi:hypothetical protein